MMPWEAGVRSSGHVPLPSLSAEPSIMGMPESPLPWTADQLEWRPDAGIDGLVIELHSLFEDMSS